MNDTPDIASVAALIGDPARSRVLLALMGGRALTASELSLEADVSASTTSAHLAKLEAAGLILGERQGRHRYFQLGDAKVAELIEGLCGVAAQDAAPRVRTGPRHPAMRRARVCYDHLAGELGVRLFESLVDQGWLSVQGEGVVLTDEGVRPLEALGIDLLELNQGRRVMCRRCLDWSVRRHHLAGGLGAAILEKIFARRWARRDPNSRAVLFSPSGEEKFARAFRIAGLV